jgi:hypothetical protein
MAQQTVLVACTTRCDKTTHGSAKHHQTVSRGMTLQHLRKLHLLGTQKTLMTLQFVSLVI